MEVQRIFADLKREQKEEEPKDEHGAREKEGAAVSAVPRHGAKKHTPAHGKRPEAGNVRPPTVAAHTRTSSISGEST